MTDEELQAIRQRVNVTPYRGPAADARALLDEVDRLRQERKFDAVLAPLDTAEILALRAEVAWLRVYVRKAQEHMSDLALAYLARQMEVSDASDSG